MAGEIRFKEPYVECGRCRKHLRITDADVPYEWVGAVPGDLRDQGWTKTRDHGWVCPDCKSKRNA